MPKSPHLQGSTSTNFNSAIITIDMPSTQTKPISIGFISNTLLSRVSPAAG
jgi:hypothetical protein